MTLDKLLLRGLPPASINRSTIPEVCSISIPSPLCGSFISPNPSLPVSFMILSSIFTAVISTRLIEISYIYTHFYR